MILSAQKSRAAFFFWVKRSVGWFGSQTGNNMALSCSHWLHVSPHPAWSWPHRGSSSGVVPVRSGHRSHPPHQELPDTERHIQENADSTEFVHNGHVHSNLTRGKHADWLLGFGILLQMSRQWQHKSECLLDTMVGLPFMLSPSLQNSPPKSVPLKRMRFRIYPSLQNSPKKQFHSSKTHQWFRRSIKLRLASLWFLISLSLWGELSCTQD